MDGDGEDRPEELTALFNKSKENPSKTVTLNSNSTNFVESIDPI